MVKTATTVTTVEEILLLLSEQKRSHTPLPFFYFALIGNYFLYISCYYNIFHAIKEMKNTLSMFIYSDSNNRNIQ